MALGRVRSRKRELGIPEGILEKYTPIMAITRERFLIRPKEVKIDSGVSEGLEAGVWYKVLFSESILGARVVAVGEAKRGEIIFRTIDKVTDILPKTLAKVTDIASKTISRVERDDFNSPYYCDLVAAGARDRVHELDLGVLLNPVKAIIADTLIYYSFYAGWLTMGWILNVLWDSFLQPQIDKVRDSINSVVADTNKKVNDQIDRVTDGVNAVITDLNSKINSQIDEVTDRVNLILGDLYAMWGLPFELAMAPVHIRNVTDNGFEWLSLGEQTIHWIAVGKE